MMQQLHMQCLDVCDECMDACMRIDEWMIMYLKIGKGFWQSYLDGLRDGFRELFIGYVRIESRPIVHDRVGIACMGHPTTPYLSLGSRPSRLIDLGDPLASP